MPDKLYPNAIGYKKMALAWSSSIIHVIGSLNTMGVFEPSLLETGETTPNNITDVLFVVATYNLLCLKKKRTTIRSVRVLSVYIILSILLWDSSTSSRVSSQLKHMTSPSSNANIMVDNINFNEWVKQEHEKVQAKIVRSIERLPPWMKQYLSWHKDKRRIILHSNNVTNDKVLMIVPSTSLSDASKKKCIETNAILSNGSKPHKPRALDTLGGTIIGAFCCTTK